MARRRQTLNPSKAKADFEARTSSGSGSGGSRWWRWPVILLLAPLTAAMLLLSFAPMDQWYLAYAALAPWCVLMALCRRMWAAAAWSLLTGLAFWAVGLYFIWWVDRLGDIALCVYLSLYWVAAGAVLFAAIKRRWSMTLVLPLVWVGLELARSYIISGFPWDVLALSQYRRIRLIQIADITSTYGVSFFVAMVNGLVADAVLTLLQRSDRKAWRAKLAAPGIATAVVLAGMLGYGTYRLGQKTMSPGPVVGVVQQDYPISLSGQEVPIDRIFQSHLNASKEFEGQHLDLVLWPETMGPKGINPVILGVNPAKLRDNRDDLRSLGRELVGLKYAEAAEHRTFSDDEIVWALQRVIEGRDERGLVAIDPDTRTEVPSLRKQAKDLGNLSRRLGCPVLIGACTVERNPRPVDNLDKFVTYNSALLFEDSDFAVEEYAKMHLVPFGEYVPFKYSWNGLHRLLRSFVPGVMSQIEPGRQQVIFELKNRENRDGPHFSAETRPGEIGSVPVFRIATPICYEGVFATVCRKMVMKDGAKAVDILANMSNDGWFVEDRTGSWEQPQHLTQYVFRAIENRVPVVRAVNTGISGLIDSSGRIGATVRRGDQEVMVQGTLLLDGKMRNDSEYAIGHGPRMMIDSRTTLYGRIGDIFGMLCAAGGLAVAAVLVVRRRKPAA